MKSIIDIKSRFDRQQAKKMLAEVLQKNPHAVFLTKHCREQMKKRNIMMGDILNILHAGQILCDPEFVNEEWRYRIETKKMVAVISFHQPANIRCVTTWRN